MTTNVASRNRPVRAPAEYDRSVADFPSFVKNPANRIALASQFTNDVEGYLFDGADGSQVALWTARADRVSKEHAHDFDEYVLVIEGRGAVIIGDTRTELHAGDEMVIPKGTVQRMEVTAGTRTLHVFGGRRAERQR
jgi:quercetin dioxygenase-like cupin family protein